VNPLRNSIDHHTHRQADDASVDALRRAPFDAFV